MPNLKVAVQMLCDFCAEIGRKTDRQTDDRQTGGWTVGGGGRGESPLSLMVSNQSPVSPGLSFYKQ